MYHLLHTKRPKLENPRADVFQVVILFWPSAFHCRFQVLISGIFPFVRKQYKVFSIHFKTSLPVTFTSIACWQVQAGGIGMETFRWAGWRDEAQKSGGKRDGQSLCWTLMLIPTIPFAICQAKENSCWVVKLSASSSSSSSPSIFSVDFNMAAALMFPCDEDGINRISIFSSSRKSFLFPSPSSSSSFLIFPVETNMAAALLFSSDVDGIGISSMISWASNSFLFSWINNTMKKERNLASNCSKLSVRKWFREGRTECVVLISNLM